MFSDSQCGPGTTASYLKLFENLEIPKDDAGLACQPTVIDEPGSLQIRCPPEVTTSLGLLTRLFGALDRTQCSYKLVPFGSRARGRKKVIVAVYRGGHFLEVDFTMYVVDSKFVLSYHCPCGNQECAYAFFEEVAYYVAHGPETEHQFRLSGRFSSMVPTPTPSTAPQSAVNQKPLNGEVLMTFLHSLTSPYNDDPESAAYRLWYFAKYCPAGVLRSFEVIANAMVASGAVNIDVRMLIIETLAHALEDAWRKCLLPECGTESTKTQFSQELVDNVVGSTVKVLFPMMLEGIMGYKEHVEYARAMIRCAKTTWTVLDAMNVPGADKLRVRMNDAFEVASKCCFLRSTIDESK
jgi:hypothetical protein